jgi:hypothetical protein
MASGAATCAFDHGYSPAAQFKDSNKLVTLAINKSDPIGSHAHMCSFKVILEYSLCGGGW